MKTISEHQHLLASFTPGGHYEKASNKSAKWVETPRYAKPGETQRAAIKRLKASLKRRISAPDPRIFPKWTPGMSVEQYVRLYHGGGLPPGLFAPLSTAPQFVFDDSVRVEVEEGRGELC